MSKISQNTKKTKNIFYWENILTMLIGLIIVLVSLGFYPYCIRVFNPIKEMFLTLGVLTIIFIGAFRVFYQGEIILVKQPGDFSLLVYVLLASLSVLWSQVSMVSLKALPFFLAGPSLYFALKLSLKHFKQVKLVVGIIITISTLMAIYGILQYLGYDYTWWSGNIGRSQVFGLFGNVNYFAEFLIIPVLLMFSLLFRNTEKRKTLLYCIILSLMLVALFLTFTRSAYLGVFIGFLYLVFNFYREYGVVFLKKLFKVVILISLFLVIVVSSYSIVTRVSPFSQISKIYNRFSIEKIVQSSSFLRRMATWKFTWLMIQDKPLLGHGIGTYKYHSLGYQAEFFQQGNNMEKYPYGIASQTHNEYLQIWAELGIIGLILFLWFILSYFRRVNQLLRQIKLKESKHYLLGFSAGVLAILIDALLGFPLSLPTSYLFFWLIIGMSAVVAKAATAKSEVGDVYIAKQVINLSGYWPFKNRLPCMILLIFLYVFLSFAIVRPFIAQVKWYQAQSLVDKQEWDGALTYYEEALSWDPFIGDIYYYMGKIYGNQGELQKAKLYFEKAVQYTDHPDLPQDRAILYIHLKEWDKAVVQLKRAISYQSRKHSQVPLYSELASVYYRMNDMDKAELACRNALSIDDRYIYAYYGLAEIYLKQANEKQAIVELKNIIEMVPESDLANKARKRIEQIKQEIDK